MIDYEIRYSLPEVRSILYYIEEQGLELISVSRDGGKYVISFRSAANG